MHRVIIILLFLTACVEPFEFNRNNLDPQLVIEAFVSDLSFNESLTAPSDGRYFTVKLKFSRPVDKNLDDRITPFASVKLIDDLANEWSYIENTREWGTYLLPDKDFEACSDRLYKLQITTNDKLVSEEQLVYESTWEKLPSATSDPVGKVWFDEDVVKAYHYPAGRREVTEKRIIRVSTYLPTNLSGEVRYFKWQFSPMWVYIAPLIYGPFNDANRPEGEVGNSKCWITDPIYLNKFKIERDFVGEFDKELFKLDIEKNNRLYENFSVLIFQQRTSKDYFYFSKLMQEQANPNGIFDTPPANLPSNFTCLNDPSKKPMGYFNVVNENVKRWYFNKNDLSYFVKNDIYDVCTTKFNRPEDPPDYAPECVDCLRYSLGRASLVKPTWWKEN